MPMDLRYSPLIAVVLSAAATATSVRAQVGDPADKPPVDVSRETTFVVEPLRPDGFVDLAAAIERRYSRSVTPQTNGAVLYHQAIGPKPEGFLLPPDYFAKLGMPALPVDGPYLISLSQFLKREGLALPADREAVYAQQDQARVAPWRAADMPHIAAWIDANEQPLKTLSLAVKRSRYFVPLLRPDEKPRWGQGLAAALLPQVQIAREASRLIVARAMRRAGEGDLAGAWDDLLVSHRLGRMIGQGATAVEALVGYAISSITSEATIALLEHGLPDEQAAKRIAAALAALPPLPAMAERLHVVERLMYVDCVLLVADDSADAQAIVAQIDGLSDVSKVVKTMDAATVDWNGALRQGHVWFDRYYEAMRLNSPGERREAVAAIDAELEKLKTSSKRQLQTLAARDVDPQEAATTIGETTLVQLLPAMMQWQNAEYRLVQMERNLRIALALDSFRADRGDYPAELAELVPDHLANLPGDIFSEKPLHYEPNEVGYRLYSIGPNGRDEGGLNAQGNAGADDVGFSLPATHRAP